MKFSVKALLAAAALVCMIPAASFALDTYTENFEGLDAASPSALADAGWLVFGNVFDPGGGYLFGYGVFGAPNGSGAFCNVAVGEGGAEQGAQQLVVFNDYNSDQHPLGNLIESNVFQEQMIVAGDEGVYLFDFQAKMGDLGGSSTALAFIKTLDPNAGYATTNFITVDMTNASGDWTPYQLSITVDAGLIGQIFQIGFSSTASNYEPSGVFYDNIIFRKEGTVATDSETLDGIKALYR